ncbi:MAG: alanine--tRNA ligase [Euryarchaeota archaeon]|jgi:alanyl-tRNA synthetase|nr:alanine--tRNA ligase [Euryarchaeota archaeon]MBF14709.1 alanine--tRNA ligase [Euryarchaeota archaeon]|tara:strand:+ start:10063 stop:13017 length:2955 start_codon:yes stop_codon:yes gene_type:complete
MLVVQHLSYDDFHFFTILKGRIERTGDHPQTGGVGLSLPPIDLAVFHEHGYVRRQCQITNLWFWTCDEDRTTCGDTHEDEYTFIGKPLIGGFDQRGKALKDSMREAFLSFFEKHDHHRVEPYPVLARWRDDIHLTIASIADFQPHVTSGQVSPPANPLTISQPCIRLTDVDAVGRSGRHLTTFEMMAHHVFNRPDEGEMYYWMEECVAYCHTMLTNTFGITDKEITYVENPWCGGGNAGPAVEVIVGGLELATLVFMNLEESSDGDIELKGDRYKEMPLQIIDTGYGLERFCWAAAGTPTIYEAIYPETVEWLKTISGFSDVAAKWPDLDLDNLLGEMSRLNGIMNIEPGVDAEQLSQLFISRLSQRGVDLTPEQFMAITEPLSRIYAIPDHLHALTHMLGDGLVPSNAKAGYLARMLARRILRMRDELGIKVTLSELINHHLDVNMQGHDMKQTRDGLLTIMNLEEERYIEVLRKGANLINQSLKSIDKDAEQLPDDLLFQLNDSHGLPPDMVINMAQMSGWSQLRLRTGFSAEMAERHAKMAKAAAATTQQTSLVHELPSFPETVPLYYNDVQQRSFDASVLASIPLLEGSGPDGATHAIVLSESCFYPEGGGQEGDYGSLTTDGASRSVLDTQKEGGLILHLCDGPLEVGDLVHGSIDWPRRKQLMDHHTAVHIVGGAARRILGPHIYQAGANKSTEVARLDITHYRRLTRDDLDAIEILSNEVLGQVSRTEKTILSRHEADKKHGFDLYQGGAPKGNEIRVLRISEHDVQACGGTHHDEPGQIGSIRVIRSTAVQDGVERLHIVAGESALQFAREQDELLRATSQTFAVSTEDLPKTAERFFSEWKEQRKRIEQLEAEIVRLRTSGGGDDSITIEGVRVVIMEVEGKLKQLTSMLQELTRDVETPTLAILGSKEGGGKIMVACTENTVAAERYNAVDILRSIIPHIKGGGGGRPTMAQGGGSDSDGLDNALQAAKDLLQS